MAITFIKKPTSPLDFEPIETLPEDVLYPGSDQEDDDDEEKRAKKKLRIELLARQYLEGRGLFIQSAALRGPFEGEWVNPWGSKKRKHGVHNNQMSSRDPIAEEGRYRHTELGTRYSTVKRKSVRDVELGRLTHDPEKRASTGRRSTQEEEHIAKRRRYEPLEEPNGKYDTQRLVNASSPSYTTKREPWLKTNTPYLQRDARNDRKSPTPTPFARNIAQTPTTPPPRTCSQSREKSVSKIPTAQGQYGEFAGFTSVNKPLGSQYRGNTPADTSRTSELQHDKTAIAEYNYIRVRERDLDTVDEATELGYEEVKRLSQEAVRQIELKNGDYQSKLSQIEVQLANSGTLGKPGRLEPYVSDFAIADEERKTAGLRASSRPLQPSPHVLPPSTYVPEFQYRYAGSLRSHSSLGEKASIVEMPEEVSSRPRATSSSSSGSDSFAEILEDAQAKADLKSMPSSHSSSPAAEGHETASVRKNISAMRRLTFSPLGSTKVAPWQSMSRPNSNSSSARPGASAHKRREDVGNASKGDLLIRKESTKSSDMPTSDENRSHNSVILQEAQVAAGAPVQSSQRPSGSSTNLLETDRPLPKYPSLDEGDSYANLSTQAAFLKAQRSFKDDVLSSLKDLPTKKIEKRSAASQPAAPEFTPTANDGCPRDTGSQWGEANWQVKDDEEPMSTQAMIDEMSPFAITTVKKRPPALNERTSFASTPTRQKPLASTTIRAPDPPLKVPASRQHHATHPINEQTNPASATATKGRPRHVACTKCRKDKRRCIHDVIGNEISIKVMEQAIPHPNARKDFREPGEMGVPSQDLPGGNDLAQSSQPIPEGHNPEDSDHPAPDDRNLEPPISTPFRFHSLSMSTSPSQNPPKPSPPIPPSHPNTTSKPASSLTSFSILPDGTLNDTSVFQDGQQQQQNWNISLPLDPFDVSPEEPARSGPFSGDGGARVHSNGPATSGRLNGAKQSDSLDLSAAIDDATSFLGTWNVEAEARKEGQLSRDKNAGVKGVTPVDKRGG